VQSLQPPKKADSCGLYYKRVTIVIYDRSDSDRGLHYKRFMIVIYDHNDSGQYYKTMIMILSYAPNLALALASVINYDHKWRHNLKRHLLTIIMCL
jgi:hypothetical protein